jgi:hypothetical protein
VRTPPESSALKHPGQSATMHHGGMDTISGRREAARGATDFGLWITRRCLETEESDGWDVVPERKMRAMAELSERHEVRIAARIKRSSSSPIPKTTVSSDARRSIESIRRRCAAISSRTRTSCACFSRDFAGSSRRWVIRWGRRMSRSLLANGRLAPSSADSSAWPWCGAVNQRR